MTRDWILYIQLCIKVGQFGCPKLHKDLRTLVIKSYYIVIIEQYATHFRVGHLRNSVKCHLLYPLASLVVGLQIMDTPMGFPCPFPNVLIDSSSLSYRLDWYLWHLIITLNWFVSLNPTLVLDSIKTYPLLLIKLVWLDYEFFSLLVELQHHKYIVSYWHYTYFTMKRKYVFFMPRIKWSGAYCFCPVCLSVFLFVCLSVCCQL